MKVSNQMVVDQFCKTNNKNNTVDKDKSDFLRKLLEEKTNNINRGVDNPHVKPADHSCFLHLIRDKYEKPTIIDNEINIKKGEIVSLGSYDGIKVVAKRRENGRLIGSNSAGLKYDKGHEPKAGDPVSKKAIMASKIVDSFTAKQSIEINHTLEVISPLLMVADGQKNLQYFNSKFKSEQFKTIDIRKQLKRIGINPAKKFKINGQKFELTGKKLIKV